MPLKSVVQILAMPCSILARADELAECTESLGGTKPLVTTASSTQRTDVVSGTTLIVSEVMVKTDFCNVAALEKRNDLLRPVRSNRALR